MIDPRVHPNEPSIPDDFLNFCPRLAGDDRQRGKLTKAGK
jgi:hypothetical protein